MLKSLAVKRKGRLNNEISVVIGLIGAIQGIELFISENFLISKTNQSIKRIESIAFGED